MFCKKCGRQLDDRDIFCPKCGTKTNANQGQPQAPKTIFCKKCGRQLNDRDIFCPKCGTKTSANQGQPQASQIQPQIRQSYPPGERQSFYEKLRQIIGRLPLKIVIPTTVVALFIIVSFISTSNNDDQIAQTSGSSVSSSSSRDDSRNSSDSNSKNNVSTTEAPKAEETTARVTEAETTAARVEETYKGSSGNTFTIPPEGYAQVLIDGTESTVPAKYESHNPTTSNNYDRYVTVNFDGNSGSSEKYVQYSINTVIKDWSKGSSLYLDDMCSDANNIYVNGYYRRYLQYTGSYINSISTQTDKSLFDKSELTVIDLSDSELKFYFNLKISPDGETHTFEGVGHCVLDSSNNSGSGSSGGNSNSFSFNIPSPDAGGTKMCAVCQGTAKCSVCNATGEVWGWKKKVTCTNCHGTTVCPFCTGGYVTY